MIHIAGVHLIFLSFFYSGCLSSHKVLDLSGNNMGPQAVRALCLALPPNCCLASLSIADNKTDTDTAVRT